VSRARVAEQLGILERLGAPPELIRHAEVVSEVAEELLAACARLAIPIDEGWVLSGAVLHDAGKVLVPAELHGPGSLHESVGEPLLLEAGVDARIARCATTHAQWALSDVTLEELAVALADTIWKGKREPRLETAFVEAAAARTSVPFWELFPALDGELECIADAGSLRMARMLAPGKGDTLAR
jgi:hypothetical protein